MKKLLSALLMLLMMMGMAISFTACGDDDDDSADNGFTNDDVTAMLGTWDVASVAYYSAEGNLNQEVKIDRETWTFMPERLIVYNKEADSYSSMSYTFKDGKLVVGETQEYHLVEQSENQIVMRVGQIGSNYQIVTMVRHGYDDAAALYGVWDLSRRTYYQDSNNAEEKSVAEESWFFTAGECTMTTASSKNTDSYVFNNGVLQMGNMIYEVIQLTDEVMTLRYTVDGGAYYLLTFDKRKAVG